MVVVYTLSGWEVRVMVRTQIYLTDRQRAALAALSNAVGKKQSELIREAIDLYLAREIRVRRADVLRGAAGMWKDRDDLPDFGKIRSEWDRD